MNAQTKRRRLVRVAVLPAVALVMLHCGGDEGEKAPEAVEVDKQAAAPVVEAPPPQAPAPELTPRERWREQLRGLESGDWRKRRRAAEELAVAGEKANVAVPALGRLIEDKDDDVRKAVAKALAKMGEEGAVPVARFVDMLMDRIRVNEDGEAELDEQDWARIARAMIILRSIGPDAKDEARTLMRMAEMTCGDPRLSPSCYVAQGAAADTLELFGPDSAPMFIEMLTDESMSRRRMAALTLGRLGPAAKSAVPTLVELLHSDSKMLSKAAGKALGGIGEAALPPLLAALHEKRPTIRLPAVKALMKMGPVAEKARPQLEELAKDPKRWTRRAAKDILGRL